MIPLLLPILSSVVHDVLFASQPAVASLQAPVLVIIHSEDHASHSEQQPY
jgi:hypothetical protein